MSVRLDAAVRPASRTIRVRRRAGLRDAARQPPRRRLPGVFASLMLLGAAGMLTAFGVFLTTQLTGPSAGGSHPGAAAPAIIRQAPATTPATTPSPTAVPTELPTPMPTARVYLLPTPRPDGSWCDWILGWSSTIADHVCHPFGG